MVIRNCAFDFHDFFALSSAGGDQPDTADKAERRCGEGDHSRAEAGLPLVWSGWSVTHFFVNGQCVFCV